MTCKEIIEEIQKCCPEHYAVNWDNSGFLVGDRTRQVHKIVLSLDATDEAIAYAQKMQADLLLTHHPLIFSAIKSVTTESLEGRRIIKLIENKINCYASHTNFDVCCMADEAAKKIGMEDGIPLEETGEIQGMPAGFGKCADMEPCSVKNWAERIKKLFDLPYVVVYGDPETLVSRVAISPGSGKGMYTEALKKGAQLLITGDIGHHDAIDAVALGVNIIDASHYGLEHIYMQYMKEYLEELCKENGIELFVFRQGCPGIVL